jgi:hypothetical protein
MAITASVAASVSSVQVFAASTVASPPPGWAPPLPRGRTVFNDSTATLYLKYGVTASTTDYTVQIAPGGFFEFPLPVYPGEVDGIWSAANGNARTTTWW